MFGSSLSPVVCMRTYVLFTLCSGRLYLQLFVCGLMSYLRYVRVVPTSSCLYADLCLIYVIFGSSLSPVVCMRTYVLFTLCSGRLYLQLFACGLMSYLRYVRVVSTSSCLHADLCLIYVICVCLCSVVLHILCCVFVFAFLRL